MDGIIWGGLQGPKGEFDSLRARLEQVESQVTQLPERIKGEIRAEAPNATSAADTRAQEWYITLDERVTALVRLLDEKVLAFSKQLAEAPKKLKAREDDCDSLRAAGSRLQARTGQLEARLDTEIEQLNDELTDLDKAGSAMRSMESRRTEMLKKHQKRMDAEFVKLEECNMKASQNSTICSTWFKESETTSVLGVGLNDVLRNEDGELWVVGFLAMSEDCMARARGSLPVGELQ